MSTTVQFSTPVPLSKSQNHEALRLMDSLDEWSERRQGHYTAKRTQPRSIFRQRVILFVPDGYTLFGDKQVRYSFEAWARNLSSGGISLLYPGQLKFVQAVICLNPEQECKFCLYVSRTRCRRVSQEFWEYGLQFEGVVGDDEIVAE